MDSFGASEGRRGGRRRLSRSNRLILGAGITGLAAPLAGADLVGTQIVDWIWSTGLVVAGAVLANKARRPYVLTAAAVAVLMARTWPSAGLAALAIGFAVLSSRRLERRAVFSRAVSGGTTVLTLLFAGGEVPTIQIAVASVAVALLLLGSAWQRSSARWRRRWMVGVALGAVVWVGASLVAALGLFFSANDLETGASQLRLGLSAARRGEVELAAAHLENARVAVHSARSEIERYGLGARVFPLSAPQIDATVGVLKRVEVAANEAGRAVAAVAGDRLAVRAGLIDLGALEDLATPLSRLARSLDEVVAEVDEHDGQPLLPPLRDRLEELRDESTRAGRDARLGSRAAEALPDALGRDEIRRYLVVFTSPAEARGRFGFPSSFAAVSFENGRFRLGEHGSTSQLFGSATFDQSAFDLGDPRVRPYSQYGVTAQFLSSTIPPDFAAVASVLGEMWEQSGRDTVDGVIRLDPTSLAPLLHFTGPVSVEGGPTLDASNVERYLLLQQYLDFPGATAPRREVLDEVASTTFERLETSNLPNPRTLFDLFAPVAKEGHLTISSFLDPTAALLREVDLDGEFPAPPVDGLLVSTVNLLGNKIDSFLSTAISYTGEVDGSDASTLLRVDLTNSAPASGLANYVIGSFRTPAPPTGTNRSAVLIHTALPIESATLDGGPAQVASFFTVGRWFHRLDVELPPGSTTSLELRLAGTLPEGPYRLDLVPSGGSGPTTATVDLTVQGEKITYSGPIRQPLGLSRAIAR